MKSIADQLSGLTLSNKDHDKIVDSLRTIKTKLAKAVCRYCSEQIIFVEGDKHSPLDPAGTPHWKSCSHSTWFQKKLSFTIMKKLAIFFTLKQGTDFELDAGLSKKEVQVIHAVLEKAFRPRVKVQTSEEAHVIASDVVEDIHDALDKSISEQSTSVSGDLQFTPVPTDPVGDPDEAIAPSEESVGEAEPDDLLS